MKKLMAIGLIVGMSSLAFAGNGMMNGDHDGMGWGCNDNTSTNNQKGGFKNLTPTERAQFDQNKADISKELAATNPDWKKIESLNEKNASIMSKAKTRMMQTNYKNNATTQQN